MLNPFSCAIIFTLFYVLFCFLVFSLISSITVTCCCTKVCMKALRGSFFYSGLCLRVFFDRERRQPAVKEGTVG